MTYFITAHEDTPARLIASETRTTDKLVAELVVDALRARGFIVKVHQEA